MRWGVRVETTGRHEQVRIPNRSINHIIEGSGNRAKNSVTLKTIIYIELNQMYSTKKMHICLVCARALSPINTCNNGTNAVNQHNENSNDDANSGVALNAAGIKRDKQR